MSSRRGKAHPELCDTDWCGCYRKPLPETNQASSATPNAGLWERFPIDETIAKSNPPDGSSAAKSANGSKDVSSVRVRAASGASVHALPPKCSIAQMATVITSESVTWTRISSLCPPCLRKSSIKQYIARVLSHISGLLLWFLFGHKILGEDFSVFKYQTL